MGRSERTTRTVETKSSPSPCARTPQRVYDHVPECGVPFLVLHRPVLVHRWGVIAGGNTCPCSQRSLSSGTVHVCIRVSTVNGPLEHRISRRTPPRSRRTALTRGASRSSFRASSRPMCSHRTIHPADWTSYSVRPSSPAAARTVAATTPETPGRWLSSSRSRFPWARVPFGRSTSGDPGVRVRLELGSPLREQDNGTGQRPPPGPMRND